MRENLEHSTSSEPAVISSPKTAPETPGVYFDVDHTVLNSDELREEMLIKIAVNLEEEFDWECGEYGAVRYRQLELEAISSGQFTMKELSRKFAGEHNLDPDKLWAAHKRIFMKMDFKKFVFPGVCDLIAELKGQGVPVGVWTQGDPWFQALKIRALGLDELVDADRIIVSQNKVGELDLVPEGSTIIDDSDRNVEAIKEQRRDIQVIHVPQETGLTGYNVEQILQD